MMSWGQLAWQILGIRSATIAQSKAALDGRITRSRVTTALCQRGCNVCSTSQWSMFAKISARPRISFSKGDLVVLWVVTQSIAVI